MCKVNQAKIQCIFHVLNWYFLMRQLRSVENKDNISGSNPEIIQKLTNFLISKFDIIFYKHIESDTTKQVHLK